MSIRSIFSAFSFFFVFFGLMSMVGNVHVAEFYGILVAAAILSIISWFKLGRFEVAKKKITKSDFS